MFAEALITTGAFVTIFMGLGHKWLRRVVGYHVIVNVLLHFSVLWFFYGTAAYALIQAEAAAIMLSFILYVYRKMFGYERLTRRGWVRFAGWVT